MSERIRLFFADPARQALAWAGLGILGLTLAAIGLWMFTRSGSGSPVRAQVASTSTPTPTTNGSQVSGTTTGASPSPTETPSPTPSPTAAPTQKPATQREQTGGGNPAPTDAPAPATTQAPPAVPAAGPYCSTISATSPPNSVIGLLNAPAGTSVSLAFDGLVGPTAQTTAAGGYRVDYGAGGADCANRVGAAISVVVNGRFYDTGHAVGDSAGRPVRFDIPD